MNTGNTFRSESTQFVPDGQSIVLPSDAYIVRRSLGTWVYYSPSRRTSYIVRRVRGGYLVSQRMGCCK